jgi:hypothetical protein
MCLSNMPSEDAERLLTSVALACVAADDAADIADDRCVACPVQLHPLVVVAADRCVACYQALQANPATLAQHIMIFNRMPSEYACDQLLTSV